MARSLKDERSTSMRLALAPEAVEMKEEEVEGGLFRGGHSE
jgi:hypothetical protein